MNGTNEDCPVPFEFGPRAGAKLERTKPLVSEWRSYGLFAKLTWEFNPWTGQPRSAKDVAEDPTGLYVLPPSAEDAHGWIKWEGGECAFKSGRLQILYKDGDMSVYPFTAEDLAKSWNVQTTIDYYRLHREDRLLPINAGAQHGGQNLTVTASHEAEMTSCWHCHKAYPLCAEMCSCGALNANVDLEGAQRQMQEPPWTKKYKPAIRRNTYGLKDKYPSPPVSRLVGFCHPGVFKEWK